MFMLLYLTKKANLYIGIHNENLVSKHMHIKIHRVYTKGRIEVV